MPDDTEQFQRLLSALMVISGMQDKMTASPDLAAILRARLTKADGILNEPTPQILEEDTDLKKIQYTTAVKSLRIIQKLQDILDQEETQSSGPPLLGTRDISCVRTTLSIIIKWGVDPLLAELELNRPQVRSPALNSPSSIIDLTDRSIDFNLLPGVLVDFMHLMFKENMKEIRQSWITSSLLSDLAVGLLTPLLILGWSSKPILGSLEQKQQFKAFSIRFLALLRTSDAISVLGTILASATKRRHIFPHLSKACGFLLSKQLLRPDGIQGLYTAIFGEEDSDSMPLDKLERVMKILTVVPSSMTPDNYYSMIVPKILIFLTPSSSSENVPVTYKRASAFTLSRLLVKDFSHYQVTSTIVLPYFHRPFQEPSNIEDQTLEGKLTPMEALLTLQTFLLNTDPSPEVISALLTPIIPELYSLHFLYISSKTADPSIRETLHGVLATWSRVTASPEVLDGLWKIIYGHGGDWDLTSDGFSRSTRNPSIPSISLQAVAELEGKTENEININANPFNLRPDPVRFVGFLKAMDRKDVSSDILLRLLNGYQEFKENNREENAIQSLLFLQLILQIQAQLSDAVLSKPEHVLTFIKHALNSLPESSPAPLIRSAPKKGLSLKDLRIIDEAEGEEQADSDDEDLLDSTPVDEIGGTGKDDMAITAVTLLLSILEGSPNLSLKTNPELTDIASAIEGVASRATATPALRQLAHEARLVLLARLASTSLDDQGNKTTKAHQQAAHDIYQQALKLLQDPIIPVRAGGLQLLRDLLSNHSKDSRLDPALLPGILSIFLQSIQDHESYIFLNAVQGLAAMVDGYGKGVLKGIMDIYLRGTGIGASGSAGSSDTMSREELDVRVRVGEALNNVVRRCGGALASYIDILLPPLLTIIQSEHLPTVLRVSASSIIAQCASTNVAALNNYAARLLSTCIEIVKLEHVSMRFSREKDTLKDANLPSENNGVEGEKSTEDEAPPSRPRLLDQTDLDPTTSNTKAPSLRRSALHLLAQLFRAHILLQYDTFARRPEQPKISIHVTTAFTVPAMVDDTVFPETSLRHANIVLGYVGTVDQDPVTKVMSNEVLELIKQYREAKLEST